MPPNTSSKCEMNEETTLMVRGISIIMVAAVSTRGRTRLGANTMARLSAVIRFWAEWAETSRKNSMRNLSSVTLATGTRWMSAATYTSGDE